MELASRLAHDISAVLGGPVRLSVTDNRSTMVSYRRNGRVLALRVHHMFLGAPSSVVRALAEYAGRGVKSAGAELDTYIRERSTLIRSTPERGGKRASPRGRCFDLEALFVRVNGEYFDDAIEARIGWGRPAPRRRRKSIRLGLYDEATREIRIHPALDRPEVPEYFVEYIVFHEMLHQLFPTRREGGRRIHHPPAFRERERTFKWYRAALQWEKRHLGLLLRG